MEVVLALDYGFRYVGVAVTDPDGRLALRHSVIDQKKQSALPVIQQLVQAEGVKKILVGVPLSLSGTETEQTYVSLRFIDQLREVLPEVEIEGVDETLTSIEAERRIKAEGVDPNEAHAEAARMMLEDWLMMRG